MLISRYGKLVWLSAALSAALIVFLCCFVALIDAALFGHVYNSAFLLPPATAVLLLCHVFIAACTVLGFWRCHAWGISIAVMLAVAWLCLAYVSAFNSSYHLTKAQGVIWLILAVSWLVWYRAKQGKLALLLLNVALLVASLALGFSSGLAEKLPLTLNPATSFHSAILLSLCALANMACALFYPGRLRLQLKSPGTVLCILIALLAVFVWSNNAFQMQREIQKTSEQFTVKLQRNVDELINTQRLLLTRVARRVDALDANFDEKYFQVLSSGYLADFHYIDYLSIINLDNKSQFSAAKQPDAKTWFDSYFLRRLAQIRQHTSVAQQKYNFFMEYDAKTDHSNLYVYFNNTEKDQNIIATVSVDYTAALNGIFNEVFIDGYEVKLSQVINGALIYQSGAYPGYCLQEHNFNISVHNDIDWYGTICLKFEHVPTGLLFTSPIALYAGFIAVLLALLSQQLIRSGQRSQQRLLSTNARLQTSLEKQQRLQLNQQQIMNNSSGVICMLDDKGYFLELSPAVERVLGYRVDELIGKPFIDFVHPDDRNITQEEAEKIQAGKTSLNFRNRYIRKDGAVVDLLWFARYVSDVKTLYGIAHDISELVRQERLQAAQQNILKLISTEHSLSDIATQICLMAQQYLIGFKASLTLVADDRLSLLAAPAFSEQMQTELANIAIGPHSLTCGICAYEQSLTLCIDMQQDRQWQHSRAFAAEGVYACWAMPMVVQQGHVLGTFALYCPERRAPDTEELELIVLCCRLAGIAIEKMQQRRALEISEQHYRSLYEFNPEPVFSLDLAGHFLKMNKAGIALLGSDEEHIIGQHYATLIQPDMLMQVEQHFAAVISGEARRYEISVRVPNGRAADFLITNLPIIVDGKVTGVFGIAKDVTERNKTSAALQHSLKRLSLQSSALQGLNDCATGIHSDWDNPQMLRFVIGEFQRIMHCRQAAVLLSASRYTKAAIWHSNTADIGQAVTEQQARFLLRLCQQCPSEALMFDSHNITDLALAAQDANFDMLLQQNRIVAAPISDRDGRVIGCLLVNDAARRSFEHDEQLLALQFAKLIFSALEYRQLLQSMIAAERDLQRQLQFNTAVTNSMSDMLLVTDMTGNVSVLNPSAEKLLQQRGITIAHQLISEILPLQPENWQPGCFYEAELELSVQQKLLTYTCKVAPLRTNELQVGWLITLHDVSAERRVDAITHERDQFFTLSLELFCLVDLNGCFVQVNPALSRVLEYSPAELIGQPYMRVIDEKDHALIYNAVSTLRQGVDVHDLEFRVIKRSGALCWLQLSAASSGGIIFCAARDITQRKAAERQLEKTLQELQRSNEELNEFAYVASHDLQEPLRKIRTFGDRLLQKVSDADPAIQNYVDRMTNAAQRMQSLINDLLSYSRLNAEKLAHTRVDISALTQDMLTMLEDVINQTGAVITTDFNADIIADERQLRQLLQNLLSNALKFHKPGQAPQIELRTEPVEAGVRLTISDNGIGFDQQHADKVFNPFQRLHSRADYAGTGIGLSIVKKIADRHAAAVEVIAQAGVGACFHITFPPTQVNNNDN